MAGYYDFNVTGAELAQKINTAFDNKVENIKDGTNSSIKQKDNTATGDHAAALGKGTIADKQGMVAVGQYNKTGEAGDLFVVGGGTGTGDRQNVIQVQKDQISVFKDLAIQNGQCWLEIKENGDIAIHHAAGQKSLRIKAYENDFTVLIEDRVDNHTVLFDVDTISYTDDDGTLTKTWKELLS